MTEREPIRVGIVGAGAISQIVHLPILVERDDVEVVALADRDIHKAEVLSRRYSVPLVMQASEMLDVDELDAVVICTPNDHHEEMAIAVLESAKHVLVERPIALTSAGAARVVDVAEKAERVLSVCLPHRFRPEAIALRSFGAGGELGELSSVRGGWLTRATPASRKSWRARRESGGGVLFDLGIPALDLCLWLTDFPAVERVSCLAGWDEGEGDVEHSANLLLEAEGEMAISVEVSRRLFAADDRYFARVMGSEGSGSLPPLEVYKQAGGRPIEITPRQPKPRGNENPYMNAYRRLLDDFVRQVNGLRDVAYPVHQAGVVKIIEAAYRSIEEGHEIEVDGEETGGGRGDEG